ncbi:hypothetical protein J1N35_003968 [Gossypium stocksii]|uniref:Alpha-D-phosphohexomutase C-terminal domain-containing protein n=1 Tax=Gossypium stocksii TaxID=47602 RepID=A0A9D3WBT9_9ROSI|nr:hypothetical protein J1N35_003968 [Gossypium stocksii]
MGQQGSGRRHPSLNQQFTELGYWLLQDWCYPLVFNDGVGADYVQKEKVVPRGIGSNDVGLSSRKFDLVDGDKILSLFALFIKEQPSILAKDGNEKPNNNSQARLGVVQTAYANGASADYLKQLGLEAIFTPTGARNNELGLACEGSEQQKAALRLLSVSKLINQAVGDALSCLLLVGAILQQKGWSIHSWNELYQDLPIVDRTAVATTNAETVAIRPPGIQEAIDAETDKILPLILSQCMFWCLYSAYLKYPKGRCFIRPSGTEDVIRVYPEASTQEAADSLANSVAKIVDCFLRFGTSQQ